MRYLIALVSLVMIMSCGGGDGGGNSNDLSCAPSTLQTPTIDMNTAELGQWTLTLTETSSTCDFPPNEITCLLNMSVSGNDVSIDGTCTSTGVTVEIGNIQGIISGDTLYWGATMSASVDDYSETDTVPCNGVQFISNGQSETFSTTVTVEWSNGAESGTCQTTFSGIFD